MVRCASLMVSASIIMASRADGRSMVFGMQGDHTRAPSYVHGDQGPILFQGFDLAQMFGLSVSLAQHQTLSHDFMSSSIKYLGIVSLPSILLMEKYGSGMHLLWVHVSLTLAGYGVVAGVLVTERLAHSQYCLFSMVLCATAAIFALLSSLVHALLPPGMCIAYFLWVCAMLWAEPATDWSAYHAPMPEYHPACRHIYMRCVGQGRWRVAARVSLYE
jgi:hypothetical protein